MAGPFFDDLVGDPAATAASGGGCSATELLESATGPGASRRCTSIWRSLKMMSRSYTNLLDLTSGNFPTIAGDDLGSPPRHRLPRVITVPGTLTELLDDDDRTNSGSSDAPSSVAHDRIIVANQLPVRAKRCPDDRGWNFAWDEDSLLLQLKDGLPDDIEVVYVGSLRVVVEPHEQDEVSQTLLERFKCVSAFLPANLLDRFYHGF